MNLETASRDELRALVARQAALIADHTAVITALETRVRELEARLGGGPPKRMPGHKAEQPPHGPPRPRKRRAQGAARRRSVPTQQVVHALARCATCGCALVGGTVQRRREVLEVVPAAPQVIEHVYLARQCPQCRRRCVPPAELAGVVIGRQRLGVGLVSLIATLREVGRWPLRTIQW